MLLQTILLSSLASVALVHAVPLEERTNGPNKVYATFDDKPSLPGVALQALGDYKLMNWNGFHLTTLGAEGIYTIGVKAHSDFKVATYSLTSKATLGNPQMQVLSGTFDLKSFFLACAVGTVESALGLAAPCTVTITGTTWDEKKVPTQKFTYTPKTEGPKSTLAEMQYQEVGSEFCGLKSVQFQTDNDLLIATLLDDVVYNLWS